MSESSSTEKRQEAKEGRGKNITIVLKFMRHGERNTQNELLELGRETTRQRARESKLTADDFDAVLPIGSNVDPRLPLDIGRSLETAQIYAREIAADKAPDAEPEDALNFKTLKSPTPYDHVQMYNSYLPTNYDQLDDEGKKAANKVAQQKLLNYVAALDTPEAQTYKKEIAGSFAYIIEDYEKSATELDKDASVLVPAGTHGGTMEFLLQQALVHRGPDGDFKIGFKSLDEIQGEFDPSEAYNVIVETDAEGNLKRPRVLFDNLARRQEDMYLDQEKLKELARFYSELHKDELEKVKYEY